MNTVIINSNNEIIATVNTDLKSGTTVLYSNNKTKNALDANRDYDLVNAKNGKISRAKKYLLSNKYLLSGFATEINTGEFLV